MTPQLDAQSMQTLTLLMDLPFVEVRTGDSAGVDLWSADDSGDHIADLARGEEYAALALNLAREHHNPFILAWPIADMIRRGNLGAVAAAFITRIATCASVAAHN